VEKTDSSRSAASAAIDRRRVLKSALAGAGACVVGALPFATRARAADRLSIRLDWTPWGDQAAFHLANVKGWYKAHDLDVDIEDGNGTVTTVQIVGNGQYNCGYGALSAMMVARGKELPVRALATFARKSDIGLMVPVDSPIHSPKDLAGKTLGYTAGSLEAPFIDLFLSAGGLTRDQVHLTNLDGSAKIGSYLAGRLDGAFSSLPFFLPPAQAVRPSRGIAFADYGLEFPSFGIFATDDAIKSNHDALKRFVSVTAGAWGYILQGHEEDAMEAMVTDRPQSKLKPDVLLGQIKSFETFFTTAASKGKPAGFQMPADWEAGMATLKKVNLVPKDAQAKDYYTNELFDEAIYHSVATA
jgi:NitT/TauT family transport system substrate-binding protein